MREAVLLPAAYQIGVRLTGLIGTLILVHGVSLGLIRDALDPFTSEVGAD